MFRLILRSAAFLKAALNIWWIPSGARASACVDEYNQCVLSLILMGLTPRLSCSPQQKCKTVRTLQHGSMLADAFPVSYWTPQQYLLLLHTLNGEYSVQCENRCWQVVILFLTSSFYFVICHCKIRLHPHLATICWPWSKTTYFVGSFGCLLTELHWPAKWKSCRSALILYSASQDGPWMDGYYVTLCHIFCRFHFTFWSLLWASEIQTLNITVLEVQGSSGPQLLGQLYSTSGLLWALRASFWAFGSPPPP